MPTKRDYYEVLGVNKDAAVDQIKKAYRDLAMRHHPDRVPHEQKKEAEEKFKEISEAYAVLSDPQKRSLYDQNGHSGIDQKYAYEDIMRGGDWNDLGGGAGGLDDLLRMVMGRFGGGDVDAGFDSIFGFGGSGRKSKRRGRDLEIAVAINLEEAALGLKKTITVPRYEFCSTCDGSGAKPGTKRTQCPQCRGQGKVAIARAGFQFVQPCPKCGGEGNFIQSPCSTCHGEGRVRQEQHISVTIPAGVDNGSTLRIKDQGEAGTAGRGDLFVVIEVRPHPVFERHEENLLTEITISVSKAVLGGEVEVLTLDGKVKMKIPAGTPGGKVFRLKDKGMPDLHGRGPGDELVRVNIDIPTRLNSEQRRAMEDFAKASGENGSDKEGFTEKIKKAFQ